MNALSDWETHKKAAGMIRNRAMFDTWRPHVVVAFPGNAGTAGMKEYARSKGCGVLEFQ